MPWLAALRWWSPPLDAGEQMSSRQRDKVRSDRIQDGIRTDGLLPELVTCTSARSVDPFDGRSNRAKLDRLPSLIASNLR